MSRRAVSRISLGLGAGNDMFVAGPDGEDES
jgi:hypothetical protein